jgi:hypothetical protein
MRHSIVVFSAIAVVLGGALRAQDITGTWQGTLNAGLGPLRTVFEIEKADSVGWKALLFSIDQSGFDHGIPATSATLRNSVVIILFDRIRGSYEGTVKADGTTISGKWIQNGAAVPLSLQRATDETRWSDPLARARAPTAPGEASDTVPTFPALWRQACGSMRVPVADTGFVFGHVTRMPGVERDTSEYLQAAWAGDSVPGDSLMRTRPTVSRSHVQDDGTYAVCGVPVTQRILLRAVHGTVASPVINMRLGALRVARRDLTLANEADAAGLDTSAVHVAAVGAGATITGVLIDEDRHRVAGASVHVSGLAASATTTDAAGRFLMADVPPGVRKVEIAAGVRAPLDGLVDVYAGDTITFSARLISTNVAERTARDTRSVIHGLVLDSARTPLDGVEVYVLRSGLTARTDRSGRFRLEGLIEGPTQLRARQLGWNPVDTTVVLSPHTNISLNFRFVSRVSTLDTIRVIATQDACKPRDFEGFECRRKAGLGVFIDPATVDSLKPRYLADLFDGVPGLRRIGSVVVPTTGPRCITQLVNGHPPLPIDLIQLEGADARFVVAVEVYTDPKTFPEWYKLYTWMGEGGFKSNRCALMVLWTEGPH